MAALFGVVPDDFGDPTHGVGDVLSESAAAAGDAHGEPVGAGVNGDEGDDQQDDGGDEPLPRGDDDHACDHTGGDDDGGYDGGGGVGEEHLDLADVAGEPSEHVAAAHGPVSGGGHNGGGLGVDVAENPHPNEFEGLERNEMSEIMFEIPEGGFGEGRGNHKADHGRDAGRVRPVLTVDGVRDQRVDRDHVEEYAEHLVGDAAERGDAQWGQDRPGDANKPGDKLFNGGFHGVLQGYCRR